MVWSTFHFQPFNSLPLRPALPKTRRERVTLAKFKRAKRYETGKLANFANFVFKELVGLEDS